MKKKIAAAVLLAAFIPALAFGNISRDDEVYQTTNDALALFSYIFATSIFADAPEGIVMDVNMQTGRIEMKFQNFDVEEVKDEMMIMMVEIDEVLAFDFRRVNGRVRVDDAGDMALSLDLEGGPVSVLEVRTRGEDILALDADGESFIHVFTDKM